MGWENKKAPVSWVWKETTFWVGEVTQLLGRSIRETLSSMSQKFYKIRLGHSKRGSNITRRAQITDPCICRQENTCLSPKDSLTHQVLWANWLTLLNTEASLSSWPVTLVCRTGQPYQILDKHRLCHARTWTFFLYSKLVTFRVLISSAAHGYQHAEGLTQTHLNIPFNLIFSFPKKNMPDINK